MARTSQERSSARSRRKGDEPRGRTPRDSENDTDATVDDAVDETNDGSRENGGSSGGVFSELKNVASDAALAVLAPVAKQAVTSAAKYAVKRGPDLLEDTVKPMLEDAGGIKGLAGQLMPEGGAGGMLAKLKPGDGDGGDGNGAGDGTGKGRRMPVQQSVDVAAPLDVVYDQWTQFEDYPKFMHRLQRVEQRDDAHVAFHAKVWGINRMWEAEIVEQRPDERILFKSVNGVQLTGVVTFHELSDRLTRVELNVDLEPDGPIEKMARGARFIKRATRGDLKRFKAFVEMHDDETGAWRGEIEEGDVVSDSDDEYYEDDESPEDYDEEPSAEEEEVDDDEEDDEEEEPSAEEEEEEEEEEPKPARAKSSSSRRGRGSSSRSTSSGRSRGSNSKGSTSKSKGSTSKSKASGSKRGRGSRNGSSSKSRARSRS